MDLEKSMNYKREQYKEILDMAYELFDKKYTMVELEVMPYKILLDKIERQGEINKRTEKHRQQSTRSTNR